MVSIEAVSYGEAVVDGKTYYGDVVVWWDGRVQMLEKTHLLGLSLLLALLKREPEAIVIGTGLVGTVKLLEEFSEKARRKAKLFVETSEKAGDIFNGLVARGRKAVAVLHVTL